MSYNGEKYDKIHFRGNDMSFSAFHEQKFRGSFDFPVEFHYVEKGHPKYEMPFHWHTEFEFVLVLDGCFKLSLDGNEIALKKGDVALIPGNVVHGGSPENCIYECIVLDIPCLLGENKVCKNQLYDILNSRSATINKYSAGCKINRLADGMFEAMEKEYLGYELTVEGLLLQILGELIKDNCYSNVQDTANYSKRTYQLKKALEFIHTNFNRTITLSELADESGMSPKYFCRFFKEMVNRTPIDYLNFYRIERACQVIAQGDKSITEIALDCGFGDLSYFIKTFKKHKGISPKQYQKSIK